MTTRWLEHDDGRIVLVIDRGDGFDLLTAAVRDDYECPARLRDQWHQLDKERQDAQAFGAACEAEVEGCWERSRGRP